MLHAYLEIFFINFFVQFYKMLDTNKTNFYKDHAGKSGHKCVVNLQRFLS